VTVLATVTKVGVLAALVCGTTYLTLTGRESLEERAAAARSTGTATPAAAEVSPALPGTRPPSGLFVGDGWTAGTSVGAQQSFACLTAATLGWICNNGGQDGTGYLATGAAGARGVPYANRVASYRTLYAADYVVVSGGAADAGEPAQRRTAAVRRTFDAVRAAYPRARVIVTGPLVAGDDPARDLRRFDAVLRAEAARRQWLFVETLDPPWIPSRLVPGLMTKDGGEPTAAGHGHLAGLLVTAIQAAGIHPGELPGKQPAARTAVRVPVPSPAPAPSRTTTTTASATRPA
jgi:hypothetical protein